MLRASRSRGFGIPVNEMQRTINGFGNGGPGRIIPYDTWRPYSPRDAARAGGILGDIPNDFEASTDLQYIPVRQAWYYGYPVDGSGYPQPQQFGADAPISTADAAELQRIAKLERTQTILQVISTVSIATIATLTIFKAISAFRHGHSDF